MWPINNEWMDGWARYPQQSVGKLSMPHRMHTATPPCCNTWSKQSRWSKHWTLISSPLESNRLCIIGKNTSTALTMMCRNEGLSVITYSVGHLCQSKISVTHSCVLVTEQLLYITPACIKWTTFTHEEDKENIHIGGCIREHLANSGP
jgi:hypothetical protein